jgi:ABC-type ATPase involved in cell division
MIELKHVDKIYPNGYKALSDINLTIQRRRVCFDHRPFRGGEIT